ncbi:MAG TPA: sugar transferase [Anaerolineales bacterium]|nr:sugar transferase [Anaerolineales bacterium]
MSRRIQPLSLLLVGLDLVIVPLGLLIAAQMRSILPFGRAGALAAEAVQTPWGVVALAIVCWMAALSLNGVYNPQLVLRWYNEAGRVIYSAGLATLVMAGLLYLGYRELSRLQFVYFLITTVVLLLSVRGLLRLYYRMIGRARPGWRLRLLVVGAGPLGQRVTQIIRDHSRWGFSLVGYLDDAPTLKNAEIDGLRVLGSISDIGRVVEEKGVDEVWVALPPRAYDRLVSLVADLERRPVRIKVVPDYFSLALVQAKPEVIGGMPVIGLRDPVIEGWPRTVKRLFDLVAGTFLTAVAAPVLGLVSLLIRLEGPGQVVIRQQRVGENGRLFDMLKFRTMVPGAETRAQNGITSQEGGSPVHKHRDDPRVTRVGRFLRRFSLDELPQLINVLRGDMSLVGPRPEMPWLVDRYEPWQRKRFAVPQGLTGWWQINGRSDKPMHLNTEDDLYYVYNYSLWLDILILLRTPLVVLLGRGAF